jgi:hypothetical protein
MRGLKSKAFRRVARDSGLPSTNLYTVKMHQIAVRNPDYVPPKRVLSKAELQEEVEKMRVIVQRPQLLLGKCQRKMVKWMKRHCPKGSFFGRAVRSYPRTGGSTLGMTITPMEAPA